ncbi:DnaJ-domain-containing protein [Testicularia cyperi]|uniref:DnaJ-domain-containing protein n=1 Tax=Testicularia cyperi TaxID=1882483 RepID=A0A317XWK4_9BASI|nr:DnaJ-domain-containing protein [Testicularia cyperi]
MRTTRFMLALGLVLLALVSAAKGDMWSKFDHEIFDLQAALEKTHGVGSDFYSILGVPRAASSADIKKAYRKKSLEFHPDKNSGVPNAQKRFEQLGLLYKILRDDRKDRYDHFLRNGFPVWKGTGYFYSRYRPGLLETLAVITLFTMGVEILVSTLTARQQREKIVRLQQSAYLVAWGPRYLSILHSAENSKLATMDKKVKLPISGFHGLPRVSSSSLASQDWDAVEKEVRAAIAANQTNEPRGPVVECLVKDKSVFLYDEFEDSYVLLDPEEASPTKFVHTWPFRLVSALVNKVTGKHEDVLTELPDDADEPDRDQGKEEKVLTTPPPSKSGKNKRAKKTN